MMETRPLRSSALSSAGYDTETKTMEVTFTGGRSYTHENVPAEVFEGLVNADSPGRFYASNIKGVYA